MATYYRIGKFRATVMGNIVAIVTVSMLLVVASSLIGLYQIRQSSNRIQFVVETEFPLTKSLAMVANHRLEQSLLMEKLLRLRLSGTSGDTAFVGEIKARYDVITSQISDEFDNAIVLTQRLLTLVTDNAEIAEFEATQDALRRISDEQTLFVQSAKDAMVIATLGNSKNAYAALRKAEATQADSDVELDTIITRLRQISESAASEAVAKERQAFIWAVLLCTVSMMLATLLAMRLRRRPSVSRCLWSRLSTNT